MSLPILRISLLLPLASLAFLAACGGGGGSELGPAGPRGRLGLETGDFADYAQDKGKGNFANFFSNDPLPTRIDLRERNLVPAAGQQGNQQSCVGWSAAYAMKSVQESIELSWRPDDPARQFSPSFVFNQIVLPGGMGSNPKDAVELLVKKGCATLATMPYSGAEYSTLPTQAALEEAANYRARRAVQVALNEVSIKAAVANGNPVVIGIQVYQPFVDGLEGSGWRYGPEHASGSYVGAHALSIIGFDDARSSFLALNSWGTEWGQDGCCWLDYALLRTPSPLHPDWAVISLAYSVEDMPNAGSQQADRPTGLQASSDNPNFVALTWTAARSVQGYRVQRSFDGRSWVDVLMNVHETAANDVPPDFATYSYRVLGIVGADRTTGQEQLTTASNTATGKRAEDATSGRAPTGVTATTDLPLTVEIRWDAMPGAESYLVVRSENEHAGPYDVVDFLSETSTRDLPPVAGRPFYYRVAAITGAGPSPFSTAAEGRSSSDSPMDLSADDGLYPSDEYGMPARMVPNGSYQWPHWVATNWSEQSVPADRHVVLVGLVRPQETGWESYVVAGWFVDTQSGDGFPADTAVIANDLPLEKYIGGRLVPAFDGTDLLTGAQIPAGEYYWFLGAYLVDAEHRVIEDADQSDNEFFMLEAVEVVAGS